MADKLFAWVQIETGYRLQVVTVRKLEFENDAFGFADKIVEKCAPCHFLFILRDLLSQNVPQNVPAVRSLWST